MHSRLLCVALIPFLASPARAQEVTAEKRAPESYLGLRIAGFAGFTSLYLTSVLNAVLNGTLGLGGFASSSANGLFIPLAGPFVAAFHPANRNAVGVTFLALDGFGQIAGATLLVMSWLLPQSTAQTAWRIVPGPGSVTLNVRFP